MRPCRFFAYVVIHHLQSSTVDSIKIQMNVNVMRKSSAVNAIFPSRFLDMNPKKIEIKIYSHSISTIRNVKMIIPNPVGRYLEGKNGYGGLAANTRAHRLS